MGVSGQHHAPSELLLPGKGPPVPTVQEAGWVPEPVWTQRLEEKFFAPDGGRNPIARSSSPVVQPVVRHYTAWATPAPITTKGYIKTLIVIHLVMKFSDFMEFENSTRCQQKL
jgi:hypothetical protein